MATKQDARRAVSKRFGAKQNRLDSWPAYLGNEDGTVNGSRAGYVFVRYPSVDSNAIEVFNGGVPEVAGLRVMVGYRAERPNEIQALGVADVRIDASAISPIRQTLTAHAPQHAYGGGDQVYINWRQITPLGVFPTNPASLSVQVQPGYIPRPGADIAVAYQTVDLTSHVPASGALYALISFNSSGAVIVTDGAVNAGGFGSLTYVDIPDTPVGNWRSAAVALYAGQAAIVETRSEIDIYDLRFPEEGPAATKPGHAIEDEGTPLTQRTSINFVGAGVAATDDSVNDATVITITGQGSQSPIVVEYDNVGANYLTITHNTDYNAFPGFAVAADGTYIVVYRKATSHVGTNGIIVQRNSTDGGLTWSAETTIVNEVGTYDARDSLLTLLANGDLMMAYIGFILPTGSGEMVRVKKSTDNGANWGTEVVVTSGFTSVSASSTNVVELANGDMLLVMHGKDIGDTYISVKVSKSTDGGATWAHLATIADGEVLQKLCEEPNMVLMDDGSLLCLMQLENLARTTDVIGISTSTDSGATWSAVDMQWEVWASPRLVHLYNDHVICVTRKFTTREIIARTTTDAGITWSDAVILDTSANYFEMEYAQPCEIYPGLIAVAYSVQLTSDYNGVADIRFLWMVEGDFVPGSGLAVPSLTTYSGDINVIGGGQIKSALPTGTAPLVVASTTKVDNLNVDLLDGRDSTYFAHNLNDLADVDTTGTGTGDIIYNNAGTWEDYSLGIGSKVTVSGTKIRFGNVAGGNYLEIDTSTGNLRLVGDATTFDDFRVEASIVKPGATAPNWKAFGPSGNLQALMFEASHHDEAYFELQMPHNWLLSSNIYPHVHWTPVNATAGNVVWELEYSWANVGDAFGAPGNMATDATAAGGVAWVHKLTDFKEGGNNYISGAGKTLSSMLVCRLHRNSNAGSDTLNQDVALLEVDFHYQIDSLGSDEPLVKDASASLLLETGDILLLETGDRLLTE